MESSKIKEELEYSGDAKVKEENFSNVVYEVEITSEVDKKIKEEEPPESPTTLIITKIQSVIEIPVNSEKCPTIDDSEIEPESRNTSTKALEKDSSRENPQSSQAISISKNQNAGVSKRKNNSVAIPQSQWLQCSLCPQSCPRVGDLITHARNEHATIKNPIPEPIGDKDEEEKKLKCPLCSKSSRSVSNLRDHFLRLHIQNKPFQCSICLESKNEIKTFATEAILNTHIAGAHDQPKQNFECDVCSKTFTWRFHYQRHKLIHTEKTFKCEYCSNAYRRKESMLRHIIAVHKEFCDRHETFKCDSCEEVFCSKTDLKDHILETHAVNTIQCKICLKKFMEEVELRKHLEASHRENRTWLECDVCSKVFKNNQELVQHLEVEHKRLFKCRKCFKSFDSKAEFETHAEILDQEGTHAGQSSCTTPNNIRANPSATHGSFVSQFATQADPQDCPMKCDFCPEFFVAKSLLLVHARKCHPNRKWECKSCDESFQLKYQLNKHELLHTSSKPFECRVCHKGFACLQYLQKHAGIHKVDKDYKCSRCEKSFAANVSLKLHMANYHGGEKPFKCDICKRAFATKVLLVQHSVVHVDDKPFSCSQCSYSCKRGYELRLHQERWHSDSNKYKKPHLGPHSKQFQNVVFVCGLEKCNFETEDKKEVAIHYGKHNLPRVTLPRMLYGPGCQVYFPNVTPVYKPAIQARYKCTRCHKTFSSPSNLSRHTSLSHYGENFLLHSGGEGGAVRSTDQAQ